MKTTLITLLLAFIVSVSIAQTQPPKPAETVKIELTKAQAVDLQNVLVFTYQNIETSQAPSANVQAVKKAIDQLYQVMFPQPAPAAADTTKKKPPVTAKKKANN